MQGAIILIKDNTTWAKALDVSILHFCYVMVDFQNTELTPATAGHTLIIKMLESKISSLHSAAHYMHILFKRTFRSCWHGRETFNHTKYVLSLSFATVWKTMRCCLYSGRQLSLWYKEIHQNICDISQIIFMEHPSIVGCFSGMPSWKCGGVTERRPKRRDVRDGVTGGHWCRCREKEETACRFVLCRGRFKLYWADPWW